jgi:hypothetical protein
MPSADLPGLLVERRRGSFNKVLPGVSMVEPVSPRVERWLAARRALNDAHDAGDDVAIRKAGIEAVHAWMALGETERETALKVSISQPKAQWKPGRRRKGA